MAKDAGGNVVDLAKIRGRDGSRCAGQPVIVPPPPVPPLEVKVAETKPVKVSTRLIPRPGVRE